MPLYLDSFKNNPPIGTTHEVNLIGLESFKKDLEKYFFSTAIVRKSNLDLSKTDLAIELECNFNLGDAVSYLKQEIFNESWSDTVALSKVLKALQAKNDIQIDIEELTIHMLDTTIVVQRIFSRSVSKQWGNILREVIHQHRHLVKNLGEMPYEVYIPVLEENKINDKLVFPTTKQPGQISAEDYFTYWGLYLDSEEEAVVYDVKNSAFIYEDLYMLNK